ncbi:MAG TPA: carboxypeptidase-like regulatory domain-containing protein, partial [Bacteroidales bacterium]|nr:carboxypeptidase-like regulatory domain-containing protein [Bacteroidales bacterium]
MKEDKRSKVSFVVLLLFLINVPFVNIGAQNQKDLYNVKLDNLTLKEAMVKITSQCGYYFVYEDADIANVPKISKDFKSSSIEQIMTECLKGTNLTFEIDKKIIYIKKSTAKPATAGGLKKIAQSDDSLYVYGKITDMNNQPLPGASVEVKGVKNKGVTADYDGNYKLKLSDPSKENVLVFNYLGMQSKEVEINGRKEINVSLSEGINELEQVVVVGYGVTKKKDIAGSIENISATEIAKTNTQSFQRAMQGKVSGVQIVSSSGIPGSSFSINIRGRGSINADTQPLYIVDGVQITNG